MIEKLPFANPIPETKIAIDAAQSAAEAVVKIYNKDFSVSHKENNEPITAADLESNKIIEKYMTPSEFPILSEESSDIKEKRLESKKIWIVDPLDGTTDFVNKTGEFTIMISLVEENKPVLGVISHPTENKLFVAQKDQGAYMYNNLEWKKLVVSNTSVLSQCRVVGSRFHQSENEKNFLNSLGILKFTSKGSSLKVLDICSAKAEIYFTTTNKIKHWDTCASNCLIAEAGGKMTDMSGQSLKYNTENVVHQNGILVTNNIIHQNIVEKYSKFNKS
jgi:3'(2'), 5'-bisphosphate nucleotidase